MCVCVIFRNDDKVVCSAMHRLNIKPPFVLVAADKDAVIGKQLSNIRCPVKSYLQDSFIIYDASKQIIDYNPISYTTECGPDTGKFIP